MAVQLTRSSRYWHHTFITSDEGSFAIDSTRTMAEQSPVIRKLIHDLTEIRKPSYPPVYLPFCTSAEFEMFKECVKTTEEKAMRQKINSDNLDAWCSVGKKFQLKNLNLYCTYFIIYEVHDVSPDLNYVLRLAEIACKHRLRLAFRAIVHFYRLYHPNILQNAVYLHKLSQIVPKTALAILSTDITQYNVWVRRFSHDWLSGDCKNKKCFARIITCRRCGIKLCPKCGSRDSTKDEKGLSCGHCYNNECQCNFDKCNTCCFCHKKWGGCLCVESKVPDIMWKDDFDDI